MQSMTSGGKRVVFFDLETTGFDTTVCDIIQLAAISGDRSFNVFTVPKTAIDRGAAEVTGFSVRDGALFLHGVAMTTVTLHKALTSFISFLWSLEQPVLLAAHNARHFDVPILTRALLRCSLMEQFQQLGSSFLDTLPLSKALYPGLESYKQENLVSRFLRKPYNAHNALGDVTALQELYSCWNPDPRFVIQFSF
ncbi:unnamed protein product [Lota lota]